MSPLTGPALGRDQLLRVLALPNDAPDAAIRSAAQRLADWLEARKPRLGADARAESTALACELADLAQSTAWWTGGALSPTSKRTRFEWRRPGAAAWLSAALVCLALGLAYAAGYRTSRIAPAEGARVDLEPGRYALEINRGDCPEICARDGPIAVRADTEMGGPADLRPVDEDDADDATASRPGPGTKEAASPPPAAASPQIVAKQALAGPAGPPGPELSKPGRPRRGAFLAREGLPAMPDGGSTAWHDRVSGQLRERFDGDGSGEIDRLEESEAIPCPVWLEVERDFDRGGLGLTMAHYFGFDGSEWHPGALAVARAHRSAVYAKMRECGLEP